MSTYDEKRPDRPAAASAAPTPGAPSSEDSEESRPATRARAKQALIIGVAVAVAVGLFLSLVWVTSRRVQVPFVAAMPLGAAEQSVEQAGLTPRYVRRLATDQFPGGLVTDQSPQAYTTGDRGAAVDVTMAVTPVPVTVPDVGMLEQAVAESALSGLLLSPIVYLQYAGEVPVGRVIAQLPRAGDTAVMGAQVVLVVSLGPGKGGATVPKLIGRSATQATADLAAAHLFPAVMWVAAGTGKPGSVVDQVPSPGAAVPVGTNVAIAVVSQSN